MIEKDIIDYLTDCGYDARGETPPDPPKEFVVVDKVSENQTNLMRYATVALQCNAETLADAMELCDKVTDDMLKITELEKFGSCKLTNSYNYTSTSLKQYRYQATFDIVYYKNL